ncbi:hypothetical protein GCM10023149_00370 [Mucilaginibacter gynuensis]|uniref:SdiA-regulated family protein n=1 Tax=Mucilaginibacter gynuensis TaxID=1302236 RepID=A0ABP8FM06_9SPHI
MMYPHTILINKLIRPAISTGVLALVFMGFSCMQQTKPAKSPDGYNLTAPAKYALPVSLTEISGLAFYKGDPKVIYAHEDETGKLFYFGWGDKDVKHVKFGNHGDYEDIAICKEQVIILRSDGVLFIFPFSEARAGNITHVSTQADILPKGEYESLYADEKTGLVYILTKNSKADKKQKQTNGFIFSLSAKGTVTKTGEFSIPVDDIANLTDDKKRIKFAPSALAKNTRTNEWYIVSSVNKLLVVTDANWKVKQTYPLAPSLFPQPEGIAFDKQNNLYISNEGGLGSGTILKFVYKK